MYLHHVVGQPGPLPESRDVVVPRGSVAQVASALRRAGVIDNPLVFQAVVWTSAEPGQLHAAELSFPAHASLRQVVIEVGPEHAGYDVDELADRVVRLAGAWATACIQSRSDLGELGSEI